MPGGDLGIVSDGFFDLRACPRRVAIVGGGYIAVELAGVLHALGAEVTVFVRGDHLLRGFDARSPTELFDRDDGARRHRRHADVEPVCGHARRRTEHACISRTARTIDGFDALIWAIGRDANTQRLDLDAAGVRVDRDGHVETDDWQNTNVDGHPCDRRRDGTPRADAGRRRGGATTRRSSVRRHVPDARLDYTNVPTVVFAHPPLAYGRLVGGGGARRCTAMTSSVYRVRFRPMFSALIGGDERTFMKLVCVGADERVVGIHVARTFGRRDAAGIRGRAEGRRAQGDFDATVAIHPTSAEELVLMGEMNRTPVI